MTNPNTQAALWAMKSTTSPSTITASSTGTATSRTTHLIHLGKDSYPVFVPVMPPLNDPTFKKGGAFAQLEEKALAVAKEVKVADVITMISELLPIDCSAALQTAEGVGKAVNAAVYNINNLEPIAFVNQKGETKKVKERGSLKDRAADITHFRFLCVINPSIIDSRLNGVDELTFKLCFALPQHLLTMDTEKVTLLSSPSLKGTRTKRTLVSITVDDDDNDGRDDTARRLNLATEETEDGNTDLTPISKRPKSNEDSTSIASPKMKMFLQSNDTSSGTKKGFFGPLTFLDNQDNFNATFGTNPTIYNEQPFGRNNKRTQKERIN